MMIQHNIGDSTRAGFILPRSI